MHYIFATWYFSYAVHYDAKRSLFKLPPGTLCSLSSFLSYTSVIKSRPTTSWIFPKCKIFLAMLYTLSPTKKTLTIRSHFL